MAVLSLPEKRLAMLMADLFGVNLAPATIARISQDYAARCQAFVDTLREQVVNAPVKHMDPHHARASPRPAYRSVRTGS